ncbi:replication protein A 70 kDa DNA-binding subunit D-like isoform X1 [Nicotiana tabacum]|uniref:Replication protein A 70 kDa DNA-binding subunit D-like isoform X1 n=3 Tax=Nicotiana TaxID=4085 RepID=A0A1S4DQN4_TOBAC|nr:PREDICTED: uncharacterized protein LOC104239277 isoform X2 [Nicotiana sylvestris]XP_016515741.1 PREDICTED: uncharacterized protein LOC107832398 isoform X2 [Nicotiana tabacum]
MKSCCYDKLTLYRNNKLEESCGEMTFNIMQTSLSSSTHISSPLQELKFHLHNILAVVVHCGLPKYAGRGPNRCREIIVTDNQKKRLLLTLWEDFSEVEGTKIQQKIESKVNYDERYPVILGRSIGISPYNGLSLQTRFNSTIQIDPAYPQALELIKWAKANKDMLTGCAKVIHLSHDNSYPTTNYSNCRNSVTNFYWDFLC